jgi:hypothetical protein
MSEKQNISARMAKDLIQYTDQIAEMNGTSRSKTLELFIGIIQDYFTSDQLYLEYSTRGDIDGRKKSGV